MRIKFDMVLSETGGLVTLRDTFRFVTRRWEIPTPFNSFDDKLVPTCCKFRTFSFISKHCFVVDTIKSLTTERSWQKHFSFSLLFKQFWEKVPLTALVRYGCYWQKRNHPSYIWVCSSLLKSDMWKFWLLNIFSPFDVHQLLILLAQAVNATVHGISLHRI